MVIFSSEVKFLNMKTIYLKRNFSLILISTGILLICLYLLDYHFYQNNGYQAVQILNPDINFINSDGNISADSENKFIMKSKSYKSKPYLPKVTFRGKCSVTIALILCQVDEYLSIRRNNANSKDSKHQTHKPVAKDFTRQINQTLVMLKSLAMQTHLDKSNGLDDCVKVVILSDKKRHFEKILSKIENEWSEVFRKRLRLKFVRVKYPKGAEYMKKMFRPCATLRLFIPELLPKDEDGDDIVLYLDTDFIFLNNVKTLKEMHFGGGPGASEGRVAAMAPCLFHYGSDANHVPFYGSSGLNAGLMLMNLTRMRESMWTNKIRMVTTMFQHQIKLADQDILNIYFHFYPEELSVISCDWNFRPFQCRTGSHCFDTQLSGGISALHGNALSFTEFGQEPLFHAVFEAFHELKLTEDFDLEDFLAELETKLLAAEENAHSDCSRFGGFAVMILNRLDRLVTTR